MNPELPPVLEPDLPAVEVLFTEDRASVLRQGSFETPGGPFSLRLRGLSPLIARDSLSLRPAPGAVSQVGRVALRHRWVEASARPDAGSAQLGLQARQAEDRMADLDRALARAGAWRSGVEGELALLAATIRRAAVSGGAEPAAWPALTEQLRGRLWAALDQAAALRAEQAEAAADLEALRAALALLEKGALRLETELEAAIDGPPERLTLALRYLLPSALWRPSYEAALVAAPDGSDRVLWQLQGTIWQRTGEDWRGVVAHLSTARPSAGTALPPLVEDRLQLQPRADRRVISAGFREQQIQSASLTPGGAPEALPGVDDGGEARHLRGEAPVDLPSDGRPHRVRVSRFEAPASRRLVCLPERAEAVFLEVSLNNAGTEPLLAGPVTLVRDGAYVGLAELPFVAPGERFRLSFGSEDDAVVIFRKDRKVEQRKLLGDLVWFVSEATLHNTGPAPLIVEVVQRVPVSELASVRVILSEEHTTAGAQGPDANGLMRWPLTVAPDGRARVSVGFRLETDSDVSLPDPW